jgi:hypothetical protein
VLYLLQWEFDSFKTLEYHSDFQSQGCPPTEKTASKEFKNTWFRATFRKLKKPDKKVCRAAWDEFSYEKSPVFKILANLNDLGGSSFPAVFSTLLEIGWRMMTMVGGTNVRILTFVFLLLFGFPGVGFSLTGDPVGNVQTLSLEECIRIALENNHRRPASRFAVEAAEARHRQALAGYWPQIVLRGGYQRMDEPPNFLFPAKSFSVPAQNLPLPPGLGIAVVDPANNIVGSISSFPEQTIDVPEQDVKLMDEDSFLVSAQADWLLFDGGMRRGYR